MSTTAGQRCVQVRRRPCPHIDLGRCRIALSAAVAARECSHLLVYSVFAYPNVQHAAYGVGIGFEVQGDIGQTGLAPLFQVIPDIGQNHA